MRPQWLSGSRAAAGLVAGRIRPGGTASTDDLIVEACRIERQSTQGGGVVVGWATVPWHPGAALGEPLERLLGWRPEEPVLLAVPTPLLVGESLTLRYGDGAAPRLPNDASPAADNVQADLRQYVLRARQQALDHLRERAAGFFDCSTEQLEVIGEGTEHAQRDPDSGGIRVATTMVLRYSDGTAFRLAPPRDIPEVQQVVFPLILGELVAGSDDVPGTLVLEEDRLTFATWNAGRLSFLRSFPFGSEDIAAYLARSFGASLEDARMLLARVDAGNVRPDIVRILSRTLRATLPLFHGAWRLISEALPKVRRPRRVFVAGVWPALVARIVCDTTFRSHCLHAAAMSHVLPLRLPEPRAARTPSPAVTERPVGGPGEFPSHGILRQFAQAVVATVGRRGDGATPGPRLGTARSPASRVAAVIEPSSYER